MILNLMTEDEIMINLPSNLGKETKLKFILLKLPDSKLYSSCTVSIPVKTTLVKLTGCSIDTSNSVGSDGTFIAPEDGVYKALYNGQ